MSIQDEVQKPTDELWQHWQTLVPRVNSVPEIERLARSELMAKNIGRGPAPAVVSVPGPAAALWSVTALMLRVTHALVKLFAERRLMFRQPGRAVGPETRELA
jgi:hypothetical protein